MTTILVVNKDRKRVQIVYTRSMSKIVMIRDRNGKVVSK